MAAFRIAPPLSFTFHKPDGWDAWIRRCDRFLTVSGIDAKDYELLISTRVYTMGSRADDILASFALSADQAKSYADVRTRFESYFVQRRNIIYARAIFNQRS